MEDIFEKVKTSVNIADVVTALGVDLNRKDKAICPFHKEKTGSFSIDRKNNIFKCFGCGASGDVITFVAKMRDVEPLEAAKYIAELFHIDIEQCAKRTSIKDYLMGCIRDVGKTDYFQKRGLTVETIKTYCLGYDIKRHAIVLPYSSKLLYYQTRSIVDKKFYKPTTDEAGPEPLFNEKALWDKKKDPVFIVESPLCALSIMQSGGRAVSICGVGGVQKLIRETKYKKPTTPLIISLDNDEAGKKASNELVEAFTANKVEFVVYNVAGDKKDPNELLMARPDELKNNIEMGKREARRKYKVGLGTVSAAELQRMHIDPPTWVIPNMLPAGLAVLAASSKVGKSWMAMQMCLAIAKGQTFLEYQTNENGCLYLALEDSMYRLKDRMNKVLKGRKAPDNYYMAIRASTLDDKLLAQLTEELEEHPDIKLVIVDTLQKVRGGSKKGELLYEYDYRELGPLQQYAYEKGICVLLIHHLRKMADADDVFNMISGSNGIMGVSDTILIIYKKRREDEAAELHMTGRDVKMRDISIRYNEDEFVWETIASPEEQLKKREKEEYEKNPIVKTIKALIKEPPYHWRGTASDLLNRIFDVTREPSTLSSVQIGKELVDLKNKLYYDGIEYITARSGKGKYHEFKKASKYQSWTQSYMFAGSDEDDD